jgi:hypothetical protein
MVRRRGTFSEVRRLLPVPEAVVMVPDPLSAGAHSTDAGEDHRCIDVNWFFFQHPPPRPARGCATSGIPVPRCSRGPTGLPKGTGLVCAGQASSGAPPTWAAGVVLVVPPEGSGRRLSELAGRQPMATEAIQQGNGLHANGGSPALSCAEGSNCPQWAQPSDHRRGGRPRVLPVCQPGTAVSMSLTFSAARSPRRCFCRWACTHTPRVCSR